MSTTHPPGKEKAPRPAANRDTGKESRHPKASAIADKGNDHFDADRPPVDLQDQQADAKCAAHPIEPPTASAKPPRHGPKPPAAGKGDFGRHAPLQPGAEESAKVILATEIDYGPRGGIKSLTVDDFPTPQLQQIACLVRETNARHFAEVVAAVIAGDLSEGEKLILRTAITEIAEGPRAPTASLLRPHLEKLRTFNQTRQRQVFEWKLRDAINLGNDTDAILAKIAELGNLGTNGIQSEAFPLTRASDLGGVAEAQDFVEGLLTDGAASVVYGPSNCGKSFWALDLAACVATGRPFRDELECEQGAVVYVALEGSHGAKNRIEALKRAGRLPDDAPLFLCFSPVSLLEPGHTERLVATVLFAAEESAMLCRLVILDTLARAMAGGDENKGQDMGTAVASIDAVKGRTGAHVLLVHHCGKNEALGARGHSSLRAAVDTEIEISRPEGETISTVRSTKQREMPTPEPMPFSLDQVTLGIDRRGKPITSCLVKHEDAIMASTPGKAGRKVEVQPERLLDLLPQPSTGDWQKLADSEMGVSKSTFYRHLEKLKPNGAKQLANGWWDRAKH